MNHGTKKLKPKIKAFKRVLVIKDGKKMKAYALFVKGAATRYKITLPRLPVPIQDNIAQIWVRPNSSEEDLGREPQSLIHGTSAFLESSIHDYSLKTNELDYFGMALHGYTWFYFVLKEQ